MNRLWLLVAILLVGVLICVSATEDKNDFALGDQASDLWSTLPPSTVDAMLKLLEELNKNRK